MKLDSFMTPLIPEQEGIFDNSAVIMIDVLRASTTICTALFNGAKNVIPCESLEKATHIYSELDRDIRFIGGERNNVKPAGFDAGNSPLEYSSDRVNNRSIIFTTSNGTKIFSKAKEAKIRLIGGFVNLSEATNFIIDNKDKIGYNKIITLCAGTNGRMSYEDVLCAGAFLERFNKLLEIESITDSGLATIALYYIHNNQMAKFINDREHAKNLVEQGFSQDVELAMSIDKFPVVPVITGSTIKKV